jgi:hypothetical protein
MGEEGNAHRILVGQPGGKRQLRKSGRSWMDYTEQWGALVKMVMYRKGSDDGVQHSELLGFWT